MNSAQLPNQTLLTDLYQLTMCSGYLHHGLAEREAVFHLTFRRCPFKGSYAIACGLSQAIELLQGFRFEQDDLEYLASLTGNDGQALFQQDFLEFLSTSRFQCSIAAMPEGTAVFPHEPLIRVQGPLWQCQLIETALLNIINFQTLIATKASRVCMATQGEDVLEFGLRRAQGPDGGISASRAAYIGGCAATSNVLAGKLFDLPVKGTHAHSWVMVFDEELESFRKYAQAMPNNCVLLVDTYDTISGVKNAIEIGRELKSQGHNLIGIRLDSGDLAQLSIDARKLLDEAGMESAAIVASNNLDEYEIAMMKNAGAEINVWGVGTRLSTAYDQPALGGVYKLAAIKDDCGNWQPRVKLSEQAIKVSDPGILQVSRFENHGKFTGDVIYSDSLAESFHPKHQTTSAVGYYSGKELQTNGSETDLLVPIFKEGNLIYDVPNAKRARANAQKQLSKLPDEIRVAGMSREDSEAAVYLVALQQDLYELKQRLIAANS